MTITLNIKPTLEQRIRRAANDNGVSPDDFILDSVKAQLKWRRLTITKPKSVTAKEAQLLKQINRSLSPVDWQTYHQWVAKRKAETLSEADHQHLILMSDQIEQFNAKRIRYVAQLAKLQGVSLPAMMKKLGLTPTTHV